MVTREDSDASRKTRLCGGAGTRYIWELGVLKISRESSDCSQIWWERLGYALCDGGCNWVYNSFVSSAEDMGVIRSHFGVFEVIFLAKFNL